jgi:hypothetical protein
MRPHTDESYLPEWVMWLWVWLVRTKEVFWGIRTPQFEVITSWETTATREDRCRFDVSFPGKPETQCLASVTVDRGNAQESRLRQPMTMQGYTPGAFGFRTKPGEEVLALFHCPHPNLAFVGTVWIVRCWWDRGVGRTRVVYYPSEQGMRGAAVALPDSFLLVYTAEGLELMHTSSSEPILQLPVSTEGMGSLWKSLHTGLPSVAICHQAQVIQQLRAAAATKLVGLTTA